MTDPDQLPAGAITHGSRVEMHYAMSLPDGTEVVSTFDEQPLQFTVGDGTLARPLELAVYGLSVGADQSLLVSGDDVFSPRDAAKIQPIPLSEFPEGVSAEPETLVGFVTPAGDEIAGVVLERNGDSVRVDFNHPLSGREFHFRVKILQVQNPLPDNRDN